MKQFLDIESKQALTNYRLQRAKETLLEADVLIQDKFYNAAVNRLYYACYYAVIALLIKNDISAQTHQGVKQMFSLHFIVTKKIENTYSRFYSQLFNDRISGDYDDFLHYDYEKISVIRPQAEEFIKRISIELDKQ
ncbi:hypothetical protein SAMD00024442_32_18 [Candidatus Symbiothrix dinenymphae]|nr:hypothetical protein SAMD00024442_32_18 [Candidatus Symbiothrix dinenymphae]